MCFLFVDRIVATIPGKLIRGVKHVTWDDTYCLYDDEGQLYFPPSLIGETLGQLAAWNVMAYHQFKLRPVAGIVSSARLLRTVRPGETLLLESVIEELDDTAVRYHSNARVGESPVFVVEGAIGPLLPMLDFIDENAVRRQFNAIHRPGDWDKIDSQQVSIQQGISQRVEGMSLQDMTHDENLYNTAENTRAKSAVAKKGALALSDTLDPSVDSRRQRLAGPSLSFDRIRVVEPGFHWIAEKLVSQSAVYFADHFPNNPVLPMTVLLECTLQLANELVNALPLHPARTTSYKVRELRRIKMNEFVRPGDIVQTHLKLKSQDDNELILSCQSFVEEKRVCIVEIVLM